jgi:hypothetical protein
VRSEKGEEENIFLYDIFDVEGRHIVQVQIKGKIYVSSHDEGGNPLVIR